MLKQLFKSPILSQSSGTLEPDMEENRHVNSKTIDLVKSFESLFLKQYICPAGISTIGYGHTGIVHNDGSVYQGRIITEEKAEELLSHDMRVFEKAVLDLVHESEYLNDDQFGSLVSFAFNCGAANLSSSTLLKRVNAKRLDDAAQEFLKWNKARNPNTNKLEVLNGLTRRRASEKRLFEGTENPYIASVAEMGKLGYDIV